MIEHLRHGEIDKAWWDAQLLRCANRLWYAQSWVLDALCPGWEALHDPASGALLPLTRRRKWGIDYLFQPYGLQQLGVFAPAPDADLQGRMLEAARARFRYIDIMVGGAPATGLHGFACSARVDQVLVADAPADALRGRYAKGHRRNLKDADAGAQSGDLPLNDFVQLFLRTTGARFGGDAAHGMQALGKAIAEGQRRGQCSIVGLYLEGRPVAGACFATWEGRSIFLKSANAPEGLRVKAMFRITDAWITRHAGSGLLLDFAGSMDPGTARFNAGFGAVNTTYFRLRSNTLPIPLRWLKR